MSSVPVSRGVPLLRDEVLVGIDGNMTYSRSPTIQNKRCTNTRLHVGASTVPTGAHQGGEAALVLSAAVQQYVVAGEVAVEDVPRVQKRHGAGQLLHARTSTHQHARRTRQAATPCPPAPSPRLRWHNTRLAYARGLGKGWAVQCDAPSGQGVAGGRAEGLALGSPAYSTASSAGALVVRRDHHTCAVCSTASMLVGPSVSRLVRSQPLQPAQPVGPVNQELQELQTRPVKATPQDLPLRAPPGAPRAAGMAVLCCAALCAVHAQHALCTLEPSGTKAQVTPHGKVVTAATRPGKRA